MYALKKKRSSAEVRQSRVNDIKAELRNIHTSSFSGALWAEMLVAGTHESKDVPPPVPMFGASRPRGRSNRLGLGGGGGGTFSLCFSTASEASHCSD